MADNFKITIGIQADPNDIKNIQSQLQALGGKAKPIVLNMDTDTVKAELVSVEKSAAKTGANIAKNINQGLGKIDPKITAYGVGNLNKALNEIGFDDKVTKKITDKLSKINLEVSKTTAKLKDDGSVRITVQGIDDLKRAVTVAREFDKTGKEIKGKGSWTINADSKAFQKEVSNAYKVAKEKANQIKSLKFEMGKMDSSKNSAEIKELQSQINKTEKEYKELLGVFGEHFNTSQLGSLERIFENTESEAKQLTARLKDVKKALGNDLKFKLETGTIEKEISNVTTKAKNLDTVPKELKNIITQAKRARTEMQTALNAGDVDKAAAAYQRFEKHIQSANNKLQMSSNAQKTANASLKVLEKSYSNIAKLQKNIASLKVDPKANSSQIEVLEKQLEEARAEYNRLESALKGDLSDAQLKELSASADKLEKDLEQVNAKVADAQRKAASATGAKKEQFGFKTDFNSILTQYNKIENSNSSLRASMDELRNKKKELDIALASGDNAVVVQKNKEYEAVLKKVKNELNLAASAQKKYADAQKLNDRKNVFIGQLDAWKKDYSGAIGTYGAQIDELKRKAKSANAVELDHLIKEFKQVDMAAEAAGKKTQSFKDKIKSQLEKYGTYLSVASVVMYSTMALKDMFRQVVAIDTAMTELKKVTNETGAAYNEFLTEAAAKAQEVGTTIDGLVQSAAGFARLGYNFGDSQELATVANMYAVVGDEVEGVEGATQSLISTMAAFNQDYTDMKNGDFAMSIIDKFNEVGNNFAISSGGIGQALQRSASSLSAANNTLDESIAMITAANTVVQDPARIGNAFKTISMRLRGAKTELEEAGLDIDGMVDSTAKLQNEIKALSGIDIMIDKDTFKSTYQVMDELSDKWKNLSDIAQASIIELLAGKHQGNVFASLMSNWETARDVLETSQNSDGSAETEHAKWAESLEAKLLKLKAAWQGFAQTVMNSDFLRGLLDGATGLINVVETLIDKLGLIPTILAGIAMARSHHSNKGFFKVIQDETDQAKKKLMDFHGEYKYFQRRLNFSKNTNFGKTLSKDLELLGRYRDAIKNKNMVEADARRYYLNNATEEAKQYSMTHAWQSKDFVAKYAEDTKKLQVAQQAQNKSLSSAKAIMKEYNTSLANNGKICQNTRLKQESFVTAVNDGNDKLGGYLMNLGNAKASLAGYAGHLVMTTAKTVGLQAVTMGLNMALTMLVGAAISFIVKKFDEWIVTADELAEKVEEVTTAYREQHKTLMQGKSNFSSEAARYVQLSKGIDNLGRNVSLTSAEYEEYQRIVNNIAEQVPTLISGYDSQGNAILNCAGTVDELVSAYNRLIKAQNDSILTNAGDIQKDFENNIEEFNKPSSFDDKITTDGVKALERMLGAGYSKEGISSILDKSDSVRNEIVNALDDAGIKGKPKWYAGRDDYDEYIKNAVDKHPDVVKSIIDDFNGEFEKQAKEMKTIADAVISNAFDIGDTEYSSMSDDMQGIVRKIVAGFDAEFYSGLIDSNTSVESYVTKMLKSFKLIEASGDSKKLEAVFDLKTQFNDNEISYGEYVKGVQNAKDVIENLNVDSETKKQLKLTLGVDEIEEEYDSLVERLTSKEYDIQLKSKDIAKNFLDDLSSEEYSVAVDIIPELSENHTYETIDDLKAAIKREIAIRGINVDLDINDELESIGNLNTALQESVSATGLTGASFNNLKARYSELESKGYDLSAMFEETANGIHLNKKAVAELEQAYSTGKLEEVEKDLGTLKEEYDLVAKEIEACNDGSERAALYVQRDAILKQINDAATLATQYKGLASAYKAWKDAEEAGSERDMYENIITGFETVEDEISRGWYDDGTIKFLELITGKTGLALKTGKQLKEVYDGIDDTIKGTSYSLADFFTVDDDGNSTNAGVYNFLDAIGQLEEEKFKGKDVVKRDDNGNIIGFDFKLAGGDKAVADALNTSEEIVQIMTRAADDAGFVVNLEGEYTLLANLKTDAEAASISIKKLAQTNEELKNSGFNEYDFNFDVNTVEDANEQLDKAEELLNSKAFKDKDGNFNIDAEGAKDALKIAETLQITKDKLAEPAYMSVDASKLDEELQEPVKLLQNFEKLTQEQNLLKLTWEDEDRIEEIDKELDEIAEGLYELPEETKIDLGINNKSAEEIEEELRNGTIKIPTELDIEAKMGKSLEDLVTLGLLEQGLIDEETAKIKLGIEVDKDEAEDEVENAVNDINSPGYKINTVRYTDNSNLEKEVNDSGLADDTKVTIKAVAEVFGTKEVEDLQERLDLLNDKQIEAVAKVLGTINVEKLQLAMSMLEDEEVQAIAKAVGQGDVEELKRVIGTLDSKEVQAVAQAFGYESVEDLKAAMNNLTDEEIMAVATALGIKDVDSLRGAVNRLDDKTVQAVVEALGEGKVNSLKDALDNLPTKKEVEVNVVTQIIENIKRAFVGESAVSKKDKDGEGSGVDGTAHINGTTGRAFSRGNWGTKNSGTALVGELGVETLVRGGRYYTIGDNGAEFIKYQRGDIIFNHRQTEELFKNGRVTSGDGRGRAFAEGTAFPGGTTGSSGTGGGTKYTGGSNAKDNAKNNSSSSKKSNSKSSNSSKDAEEFKETIDWIEVAIARIERAIDRLDTKASRTWKSWSYRNKNLTSEISKIRDEIDLQERAYKRYMQEANSVGLSESYKKKVREGKIDIETIKNEDLKEKIDLYKQWHEKALACKDAILELEDAEMSKFVEIFDNTVSKYDGILARIDHQKSMIDELINRQETDGHIVSTKYYEQLKTQEKNNIAQLEKEKAELIKKRADWVAAGGTVGSEDWNKMTDEIEATTLAIEEGKTALIEYDNAIRQIKWDTFDLLQEQISNVTKEADFLIELMSSDKLYDDNGRFTDQGMATMGLHGQNYDTHMYQADQYAAEIANVDKLLAKDPGDQELLARRQELVEAQQESILAAKDEKEAIRDMVKEGIELELDALQERIDKYEESLDAAKDLYDYQKKVKEQTTEIADLEKQMAAYAGDTSEEARAKIQELKVSLEDAKEELKETEYDKYISDQKQLLDDLYTEYETVLNSRLDNIDALLADMIDKVNTNASAISTTITTEATNVGYDLSAEMQNIWSNGDGSIKNVITMYSTNFANKLTTVNDTLNGIKAFVAKIAGVSNKGTTGGNTGSGTSNKNSGAANNSNQNKNQNNNNKNQNNNNKAISTGGKIKASGAKIYDYKGDKYGETQFYKNDPIYKVLAIDGNWIKARYHKLTSGVSGWFKKGDVKAYAKGAKYIDELQAAWTQENGREFIVRPSDGAILTPLAKGDSVLNANASNNIWDMANNPSEFIKNNLDLGIGSVPNNINVQNNYVQNLDNVVFNMPNVHNYSEMLSAMQKDKNFEKLILSMSVDRIAGRSSLAKNKAIR